MIAAQPLAGPPRTGDPTSPASDPPAPPPPPAKTTPAPPTRRATRPGGATPEQPLTYRLQWRHGTRLLAYDEAGDGRIVEVLGDVETAEHIAVLVPGNDHTLGNYFDDTGPADPRANGRVLRGIMRAVDPGARFAVVVWVGYRTPRGLVEASRGGPALRGARDLARLTHILPRTAHLTLVGHSYGAVVCAHALSRARVHDMVALASPGMGVRSRERLGFSGRIWAARCRSDWVRFFPNVRFAGFGHGASPANPRFGARVIATGTARGHCDYYRAEESVTNIARIVLGRHDEVTLDPRHHGPGAVEAASRPTRGRAGRAVASERIG